MNSTDLHIKYKMETGGEFQWPYGSHYTGNFHATTGYSREYAQWLEEQLLIELQKNKDIENLEDEIIYLQDEVDYWRDQYNNEF